jgi:heat shock protein HtpX
MAAVPARHRLNIYSAVTANRWRSIALVAMFIVIVSGFGFVIGELYSRGLGGVALAIAALIAVLSSAGSYFLGDQIVLGASKAREVTEGGEPELVHVVSALATGAGLPMPRIYVIDDPAPNAFATGRDPKHASLAVTRGLLMKLDRTELEGVVAHELAHVRNFDIRFMLLITVLVGMVALMSNWMLHGLGGGGDGEGGRAKLVLFIIAIVLAVLTPIAAQLIRFAVSRQREYLADADGVLLTRYPPGLASALRKIAADESRLKDASRALAPLYFANPMRRGGWFDTHPPIEERIRRLESM